MVIYSHHRFEPIINLSGYSGWSCFGQTNSPKNAKTLWHVGLTWDCAWTEKKEIPEEGRNHHCSHSRRNATIPFPVCHFVRNENNFRDGWGIVLLEKRMSWEPLRRRCPEVGLTDPIIKTKQPCFIRLTNTRTYHVKESFIVLQKFNLRTSLVDLLYVWRVEDENKE